MLGRGFMMKRGRSALNHVFSQHRFSCRPEDGRESSRTALFPVPYRIKRTMLPSLEVANEGLPLPTPNASGDELFRLGLLYSTGQGGAPLDYVSAHMLFNLAAMRGSVEAKVYRKELAGEMASEEVAEAQRQAREWLAHA
jgi:TPR repeat protein